MKLSVFLLLVACLHVSAKSYSQEKVTIVQKQVSLKTVLQDIQRQTGYSFVLNSEVNEAIPKLNLDLKNASIREVLDACLKGQPFAYVMNVTNKVITIQRVTTEIAVAGGGEKATREIRGKVVNEKGQAMPGVSVFIKGSTNGTTTDENGLFVLTGYTGSDPELRVSFIGYSQQVVKWSDGIVIKMQPSAAVLQDVAVRYYNNGYEKLSPERSPGSYFVVDEKTLNQVVSTDLLSRLNGRLGGAYFNKIGDGTPENIIVRGLSTINTGTAPLIVVDNFPYSGDISNINPNDVESITELRDANAASVWGAKAGNGVLVITTKKAKFGQPFQVSFNSNVTIQNRPNLYYGNSYLNSKDFIDVEQMLYSKGFYDASFSSSDMPPVSPVVQTLHDRDAGLISAADASAKIAAYQSIDNRAQRKDYFYQKGVTQQYSLAFSGGNQNLNYYLSMGYDKGIANARGVEFNKQTVHSVTNFIPAKNFEVQVGFDYTHTKNENNAFGLNNFFVGGGKGIYPYAVLKNADGSAAILPKDYSQSFKDTAGAGKLLNWNYKPLDEYGKSDNSTTNNTFIANISAKYSFSNSLNLNILYQFTRVFNDQRYYRSPESYFARNIVNQYTQRVAGTTFVYPVPIGGVLDQTNNNTIAHNFRPVLSFNHTWNERHQLNAIAGMEISQNHSTSYGSPTIYGYDENLLTFKNVDFTDNNYFFFDNIGYSSAIPNNAGFSDQLNRFVSYYTNFSYTYGKKYTISGSVKKDESNLFGVNSNAKGVPLWSGGFKWDITKESFYHFDFLPLLNLRATYGYCGNVNNSLSALPTIGYSGTGAIYTGLTYAYPGNPNNPDLRWEKVGQLNLGIDYGFRNNTVSGRVEYYHKKAVDLLALAPIDYTTGFPAVTRNVANLKTSGVDLEFRWKILDKGFKWNTQLLGSFVKSTVTKYYLTNNSYSTLVVSYGNFVVPLEGHDAYSIYSFKFAGLDPSTGDPQGYVNKQISKDYTSLVNPKSISDLDENGPGKPPLFGSLYNTFSWKGLSATIGISGAFNYYFRKNTIQYYSLFNSWLMNSDFVNRWQKSGDESKTTVPSMTYPANNFRDQFYQMSSATILKGDVIRIRDISVSYDFNSLHLGNFTMKRLGLYMYLNNVGIIWRANREGFDPDAVTGAPVPFSMSFGVRATL